MQSSLTIQHLKPHFHVYSYDVSYVFISWRKIRVLEFPWACKSAIFIVVNVFLNFWRQRSRFRSLTSVVRIMLPLRTTIFLSSSFGDKINKRVIGQYGIEASSCLFSRKETTCKNQIFWRHYQGCGPVLILESSDIR